MHPEYDNTSYPLQLAGPLPLPLLRLPTADGPNVAHRLFMACVNARSSEADFQHSYCNPQWGTWGHFAGSLSSSQHTTTNHLWGRTCENILLLNGFFSLLCWIRQARLQWYVQQKLLLNKNTHPLDSVVHLILQLQVDLLAEAGVAAQPWHLMTKQRQWDFELWECHIDSRVQTYSSWGKQPFFT